jgi:hypothetical protein
MRIENVNGRKLVCGHIFPANEVEVGQRWAPADGSDREVEIFAIFDDHVFYRDLKTGDQHRKDAFGFQCRYCKIVE